MIVFVIYVGKWYFRKWYFCTNANDIYASLEISLQILFQPSERWQEPCSSITLIDLIYITKMRGKSLTNKSLTKSLVIIEL